MTVHERIVGPRKSPASTGAYKRSAVAPTCSPPLSRNRRPWSQARPPSFSDAAARRQRPAENGHKRHRKPTLAATPTAVASSPARALSAAERAQRLQIATLTAHEPGQENQFNHRRVGQVFPSYLPTAMPPPPATCGPLWEVRAIEIDAARVLVTGVEKVYRDSGYDPSRNGNLSLGMRDPGTRLRIDLRFVGRYPP